MRRRARTHALICALGLLAHPLRAQDAATPTQAQRDDAEIRRLLPGDGPLFMDPTYLSWVAGSGEEVDRNVEISLMHHLRVRPRHNGSSYGTWLEKGGFRFTMNWSFGIDLRRHTHFREVETTSSPIRTPSIRWEWAPWPEFIWHRPAPDTTSSTFWFASGGLNHYSNGQTGCLFVGETRQPPGSGDCAPRPVGEDDRREINAFDGSFSSNFFDLTVGYMRLERSGDDYSEITGGHGVRLSLRAEADLLDPDEDFIERYGSRELAVRAWIHPVSPRLPLPGFLSGIVERGYLAGPLVVEADGFLRGGGADMERSHSGVGLALKWLIFGGGEWGPFARIYTGTNYYNINFENTVADNDRETFLHFGFTWEHGRLRSFPTAEALRVLGLRE